ncbi:MAG: N-acetylmuramoyl-L-alanine amidase, partial [Actinobacteria bacterium]|nr:N-acetylmuramoyl-L-alanine amidase [Actinomycetota bacterium]
MHRRGDTGAAVAEVRARLAHLGYIDESPSDVFDDELDHAVRTFQQERGLTVDGIVGPDTFRRLDEARWKLGDRILRFVPGHLVRGDDVADLQRRLNTMGFNSGRVDGAFGRQTDVAVREFQKSVGDTVDGTCGPETFRAFERLVRTISGGNAANLRGRLTVSALQTGIADKVIVLDPGFDANDEQSNEITRSVAMRVEGRLAALGTQVFLTRSAAK